MNEIFLPDAAKLLPRNEIARQYFARMVTSRHVRLALRQLRGTATPEEFADEARVARATVYRIDDLEGTKTYSPRIETIAALAQARGLTLSSFFARIEGLHVAEPMGTDQPPDQRQADHGRSVSDRPAADTLIQREYIEELVAQFVNAFDRLVTARTKNQRAQRAKPAHRRSTSATR